MQWTHVLRTTGLASSLQSRRGLALLSYCYLIVIWIMVLTTSMLTRSSQELRNAERSRGLRQAFWNSEAGLDDAIYSLLWNPPTGLTLPAGCTTSEQCPESCAEPQLLEFSEAQGAAYRICLVGLPARYQIASLGAAQGTEQSLDLLTGVVERVKPSITFTHAILAADSIDTRSGAIEGSIAVLSTRQYAIHLKGTSSLKGDIFLAERTTGRVVKITDASDWVKADGSPQHFPEDLKTLEEIPVLDPVVVPFGLENVRRPFPNDELILKNYEQACLDPGTYYARLVSLKKGSEVCTFGKVDLYVEGKIEIEDSWLYGQPQVHDDGTPILRPKQIFLPENLRIFAFPGETGHTVTLHGQRGVTAAFLYAPEMRVQVRGRHQLRGAIISKDAVVHNSRARSSLAGGVRFDSGLQDKPAEFSQDLEKIVVLLWGQEAGGTGGISRFIETLLTYPSITDSSGFTRIARGGGGGGGGGGGSTVICTELFRQGYLPESWFAADMAYARTSIDPATLNVYQSWASYVVAAMQRSRFVTHLVAPLGVAWAQHMAFSMGASPEDNALGRVIQAVGLPVHRALARLLFQHQPAFRTQ